jgi:DNA-binding response OmpR family regulator
MEKAQKTVLVVDDDEGILEVVKIVLEQCGYTVVPLNNGKTVIQTIGQIHPDLILLDIWLAGVRGEDILRDIREQKSMTHIPVVIMSAQGDTSQITQRIGADGYIDKPFDIDQLAAKVDSYFKH